MGSMLAHGFQGALVEYFLATAAEAMTENIEPWLFGASSPESPTSIVPRVGFEFDFLSSKFLSICRFPQKKTDLGCLVVNDI
ncbi:MAG: hypothetical protein ACON4R_09125, partial [Akkermansiaceae bacterium]